MTSFFKIRLLPWVTSLLDFTGLRAKVMGWGPHSLTWLVVNDQELDLMHGLKNSTKAATSTQDLSAPNKRKILQKVKLFED